MPCATPPWICPARIIGLITVPQSCTTTYLRISSASVSGSTSTIMACTPLAVAPIGGPKYWVDSRPGSGAGLDRAAHRVRPHGELAEPNRLARHARNRCLAVRDLDILLGAFEVLGRDAQ